MSWTNVISGISSHVQVVSWDCAGLCSAIAATITSRIPLLYSPEWSVAVAFSRIRRLHCCHFIAGVTVPAVPIKHGTALDTIQESTTIHWAEDGIRDRSQPKPPQRRFPFISNKLIRSTSSSERDWSRRVPRFDARAVVNQLYNL